MTLKHTLLISALALSSNNYAQQLPVIKASSKQASIQMGMRPARGWNIDPREKLDIYNTPKLIARENICFRTDIDSIEMQLAPGEHKDFIVLLNETDSCLTRIQNPVPKDFSNVYPEIHDTIPLFLNEHNANYVRAILNGTDTLILNFDTGSSDITLTKETLQNKLKSSVQLYNKNHDLQIGTRHYQSPVYPAELTAHGTEGRFGWDIFDGYIVELNYDKQIMIVHSKLPASVRSDKKYSPLPMYYVDNIFLIQSTIRHKKANQTGLFLFDSGYERTAMLDSDLLKAGNFPVAEMPVIKKVLMKGGQGNEIPVITSGLDQLSIGKYTLRQVPVQLQNVNKPMRGLDIHILGNEVLKRFNTVMDFQHNMVYLKPSKHFRDDYLEQQSKQVVAQ